MRNNYLSLINFKVKTSSASNITLSAINQCYHNCIDYKKRQIKNTHGYKKKKTPNTDIILTRQLLTKSIKCIYLMIHLQRLVPR